MSADPDWNKSLISGSRCRREYCREKEETEAHHQKRIAIAMWIFLILIFALYALSMLFLRARVAG